MEERAIENLKPGADNTKALLAHLLNLLENSERRMKNFYHRWAVGEQKFQAYISLPDYEKEWKAMNENGEPPHPTRIIVPFSFAAVSTMTTFLLHTFYGRRPHTQLGTNNPEQIERARKMESVLQFNADWTRQVRKGYQHFLDVGLYGVGIFYNDFVTERARRTTYQEVEQFDSEGNSLGVRMVPNSVERTIYEGNEVTNIDPFMFFPDWRVPMGRLSRDGEYAFWRAFQAKNMLRRDEYHPEHNPSGIYSYVSEIKDTLPKNEYPAMSRRNALSRGISHPGSRDDDLGASGREPIPGGVQLDQGCVWIVPRQYGFGESTRLERWIFTIANKETIIQAEHYDADHGQLPLCVTEPFGMGYAFGAASPIDYITPIQDLASWLVNSHIENVRAVLNDQWVVDPASIEMDDLQTSRPGKRIRLRQDAVNRDVRAAIMQLGISDVTTQNMTDLQLVMSLGMLLLGFNENIMGQVQKTSHTTATESRQSAEASVSRLAAIARIISSESMADLAMQQTLNIQQYMTEEFWITVLGSDGQMTPLRVSPDEIVGEYQYVIHDGTLPLDRVALLDVWKELTLGAARDPELRQRYDVGKMFEYSAELAGARNIESMRREQTLNPNIMPDDQIEEAERKGDIVPIGGRNG